MTYEPDELKARLRAALGTADEDVVEELAQHARALYESARADGESIESARHRVDLQIALWAGDAALLTRRPSGARVEQPHAEGRSWLAGLAGDVRYALRLLRRRAAFTVLVASTMALGIGGTTTLFSVAYGVLSAPLPWADAERLALVRETRGGRAPKFGDVSNGAYLAWREQATTIEGIAAWQNRTVTISGHGDPERMEIAAVSPEIFALLGSRPLVGTILEARDVSLERGQVIVLSESLWRSRFGADRGVIGRPLGVNGRSHTIVGVLPDRQAYPDRLTRAWVPLPVPAAAPNSVNMLSAVVKLRPGVSIHQAEAEAVARGRTAPEPIEMLAMAMYGGTGPLQVSLTPLREARTADLRRPLLLFLAAVGLLFVTATANVASLLLARATTRVRELALRAALGASVRRVTRQLMAESVALSLLGGLGGLALARLLHALLPSLLGEAFMAWTTVSIDGPVVAFAAALSILAGVAVGVLPAFRVRRLNLVEALAQDGTGSVGASRRSATARLRLGIMTAQVAIACVLLVGAALLARSFDALLHAPRGYEPSNLLTAWVPMPSPAFTPERRAEFTGAVIERLRQTPGITAAAFSDAPPAGRGGAAAFDMDGRTVRAEKLVVSPGFFEAMGIDVLDGRTYTEEDALSDRPVLIVDRTFAREHFDAGAAGRYVRTGLFDGSPATEIIGVVDNVRHRPDRDQAEPQVYVVNRSRPAPMRWGGVSLLVRTPGDPVALIPALRSIVREQNPTAAVDSILTMEERLREGLEGPRLAALLLGGFAGVALLIAAVGLFGILSYTVAQRSREIAVRTALGARPRDVAALVLREGLVVAGAGAAIGLLAAFLVARTAGASLYGVTPGDPLTYSAVPLLLLAVALVACLVPARRAARMDPLRVLKAE